MFSEENMRGFRKSYLAAPLAVVSGAAVAALPAGVTEAITGLQTDGLLVIAAVTGVVVAFIAPVVIIKLIKRFSSKV